MVASVRIGPRSSPSIWSNLGFWNIFQAIDWTEPLVIGLILFFLFNLLVFLGTIRRPKVQLTWASILGLSHLNTVYGVALSTLGIVHETHQRMGSTSLAVNC